MHTCQSSPFPLLFLRIFLAATGMSACLCCDLKRGQEPSGQQMWTCPPRGESGIVSAGRSIPPPFAGWPGQPGATWKRPGEPGVPSGKISSDREAAGSRKTPTRSRLQTPPPSTSSMLLRGRAERIYNELLAHLRESDSPEVRQQPDAGVRSPLGLPGPEPGNSALNRVRLQPGAT